MNEYSKIYFVSGHLDLSTDQWTQHYLPHLSQAIHEGSHFVMGEAIGADQISINYLYQQKINPDRVTIYHLFEQPRHNPDNYFPTQGGFTNELQRDEAMTLNSTHDLVWVRPEEETKKLYGKKYRPGRISGTAKNLLRRKQLSKTVIKDQLDAS